MIYRSMAPPQWGRLPGHIQLELVPTQTLVDGEDTILFPLLKHSWLRVSTKDLENVLMLDGRTIDSIRNSRESIKDLIPLLDSLYSSGLLSIDGHSGLDAERKEETSGPSTLLIKMTGACNIACSYCYDFDQSRWNGRGSSTHAKHLIADSFSVNDSITVMFHGGEPLLHFSEIKELVSFANEIAHRDGKKITYSIQTNGLLLDEEIVQYLLNESFDVGISLDGPLEIHNLYRVDHKGRGTFEALIKKFDEFPEFMRTRVGFMSVITQNSVFHLDQVWQFFRDLDVQTWKLSPMLPEGRACTNQVTANYIESFVDFLEERLLEIINGSYHRPYLINLIQAVEPFLSRNSKNVCTSFPCGAGRDFVVLDAKGALRSCDCSYRDDFFLGNADFDLLKMVKTEFKKSDLAKREQWLVDSECGQCVWLPFCGGTCPAEALANTGTVLAVDELECNLRKRLFPRIAKEVSQESSNLREYIQQRRSDRANSLTKVKEAR